MSDTSHIPVLLDEVITGLNLKPGDNVIDATAGGGGHAEAILAATAPHGKLIAIDWDPQAVERLRTKFRKYKNRLFLTQGSYTELQHYLHESRIHPISALLLDLGLSSDQLQDRSRGFSFTGEGPLDMRFSGEGQLTAERIVNTWPEDRLAHIFREYGEERHATRLANKIVAARRSAPITSVETLVSLVARGARTRGQRIHPATRIFQALRIATNNELDNVRNVLPEALAALKPGGRLAVISFHSLEDRIVKQFMKHEAKACICPPELPVCVCNHQPTLKIITKKPITPSHQERSVNPSARSAKLRIAEKL